jgi:hypothetical protein
MAEPDGTLLGNGFTDIKESKLFFKENWNTKSIKQAVRENGKVLSKALRRNYGRITNRKKD